MDVKSEVSLYKGRDCNAGSQRGAKSFEIFVLIRSWFQKT